MGKPERDANATSWRMRYDGLQIFIGCEFANFIEWANKVFPEEAFAALPLWEQVSGWRGKLIAVCDYDASYTPGPPVWNEGYPVWWHLTNIRLLKEPIPCRGNVGMWELPENIVMRLNGIVQ